MSNLSILEDTHAFGKLESDADGNVLGRHLLIDHMIDVAACFFRLARCRSIRRSLERSARRKLDEQDISRLAVLAFLHDIGKANSGFQAKRWKNKIPASWPVQITAGHGVEAVKLFQVSSAAEAIEPLIEQVCTWGDAADSLLTASISHHGRPIKDAPGTSSSIWKSHDGKYDPAVILREIAASAPILYPSSFEAGGQPLPDAHAFGHLFAGLVQLADWLGSDTRFLRLQNRGRRAQ